MSMFLTIYTVKSRLKKLEARRYHQPTQLFPMRACDDLRDRDEPVTLPPVPGKEFSIDRCDHLRGYDRYVWAATTITVPETREGFDTIAYFDFGGTDKGYTKGFEGMLYLNGQPYSGCDSNHHQVRLPNELCKTKAELMLLLWSGLCGGGEPQEQVLVANEACICFLHRATEQLYYLVRETINTHDMMTEENPLKQKLLLALGKTFEAIDLEETPDVFYKQATEALASLETRLGQLDRHSDITVHCIGHTHLDLAWLWRVKHTKEKGNRSLSTVLRLMEQFPEYYFLQSQPQLCEFLKESYPETYRQIKARVEQGRYEVEGGMWVEADCNLISGESMVRQFLLGSRFIEEEFGKHTEILWLPDVFGYSHAIPQILKGCGINTFMTTKISWNEYNKIPYDTFYWRGIDGSKVLTHFITTPSGNPKERKEERHYTKFAYECEMNADIVAGVWRNYQSKELSQDVAISYGYGDGGGGPTKDMLMSIRAMDKIPGLPKIKTSTATGYFAKLHENIATTEEFVPTWSRELYFENHRGTYTSQGFIKRMNRKTEYALQRCEALGTLGRLYGATYSATVINQVWKTLLLNQFHDIIPGSSIADVYLDSAKDFAACNAAIEEENTKTLAQLRQPELYSHSLYNMTGFVQDAVVFIPCDSDGAFTGEDGSALQSERVANGHYLRLVLRPTGFTNVKFTSGEGRQNKPAFSVSGRNIETPLYIVAFNEYGHISRLYDKENLREVLKGTGNCLRIYEDIPIEWDAWNIDIDHTRKYHDVKELCLFELLHNGDMVLELGLEWRYRQSVIKQKIKFYSHSHRIDFETEVDWQQQHELLKTLFEVDVFANKASYDIQFGNVERTNHNSNSWDYASFEVCAHKWTDLSENSYGVSLLNDCKYGHSVRDNTMAITLIKSATYPDPHADRGRHQFNYAVLPHVGGWRSAGTEREAQLFNMPPMQCAGSFPSASLFYLDNEQVVIDTVKPAEDGEGIILRVHEAAGGSERFCISSDYRITSIAETNLLEQGRTSVSTQQTIRPYQIKSYYITLERS